MQRPNLKQWAVLWLGALWTVGALIIADEYVWRAIFGGVVLTALAFWQFAVSSSRPDETTDASPFGPAISEALPSVGDVPEVGVLPAAQQMAGVHGWLLLLTLSLIAVAPIAMLAQLSEIAAAAPNEWSVAASVIFGGILTGWGMYAGFGLWNRWPNAPRIARRYFVWGTASIVMLDLGLVMAKRISAEQVGTTLASTVFPSLLWYAYLRMSRRVRATYTVVGARGMSSRAAALTALLVTVVLCSVAGAQFRFANPYNAILRARNSDRRSFDDSFIASFKSASERGNDIRISSARILTADDLGTAVRLTVTYSGTFVSNGATLALTGESRQFFHRNGTLVLQALCLNDLTSCDRLPEILNQADANVVSQLDSSNVGGILPAADDCSLKSSPMADGKSTDVASCSYTPGLVMQLYRMSAADTFKAINAFAAKGSS